MDKIEKRNEYEKKSREYKDKLVKLYDLRDTLVEMLIESYSAKIKQQYLEVDFEILELETEYNRFSFSVYQSINQ